MVYFRVNMVRAAGKYNTALSGFVKVSDYFFTFISDILSASHHFIPSGFDSRLNLCGRNV